MRRPLFTDFRYNDYGIGRGTVQPYQSRIHQLPYVLVVAVVSCITYIIAGFVQSPVLPLIIGIVLMVGTLFGIKYLMKNIAVRDKKHKVQ